MKDIDVLGGYPINGTPSEDDALWFTGVEWVCVPFGERGSIVAMTSAPYPNVPFVSNGYIVSIEHLQPGDILCAVLAESGVYGKEHEYITNVPFIDQQMAVDDLKYTFTAYPPTELGGVTLPDAGDGSAVSYSVTVS